jgi:acyl-CoA synthetase (AMP-forming)/AMP-acid ligase II
MIFIRLNCVFIDAQSFSDREGESRDEDGWQGGPRGGTPDGGGPAVSEAGTTLDVDCLGSLAAVAAARWPDREFAVIGDRRLSYTELSAWTDAVAHDLVAHGVGPGDNVLVHLPNCLEVIVAQLAAWRIGAVAVPVVAIYRERELSYILRDSPPAVLVTAWSIGDRKPARELDRILAEAGLTPRIRYLVSGEEAGWSPFPGSEARPAGELPDPADPDACCLVLYTSGTTSAPKGARLSSRAIFAAVASWDELRIGPDDVALAVAPLAHIAGMNPGCLVPLRTGCRVAILPRWNPEDALELIDREKATFSTGANVFLRDLVEYYERAPEGLHRLRDFVSGGAATPPSLVERADALGIQASRAYGMTETAGVIAIAGADAPLERRANFDGQVVNGAEVIAVGEAGEPLPPETEGDLRIRGPHLLLAYTDPVVSAAQLRDGWFDPGDVGIVTEDGWLRITGRTKDIINRGGEKFSAREIEEAILAHPSIADAAVIPVPHPRFGEAVCAFVVIGSGREWVGEEEMAKHLLSMSLARAKTPVEWHVTDTIPTTLTGKVQKHRLADIRAAGTETVGP